MFTLDGAIIYYVKVQEKEKEKQEKICFERYIFEKCSQPLFGFLGI
jgi:hypothetical protein